MHIVLTGAGGFVGSRLLTHLSARHRITAIARAPIPVPLGATLLLSDLTQLPHKLLPLSGQDCVIHCAARAHRLQEDAQDPVSLYRQINCALTLQLARQAAAAGVRRFIFLSSIKVLGEETPLGHPYRADDPANPQDAYAQSKWEAEQGLRQIEASTGLEVVIIRPALVYGPNVKANMRRLMQWIDRGWPLPFGCVQNQRSFLACDNLADLVEHCLSHPKATQHPILASDGMDLSTPALIRSLAHALERPARLINTPLVLLKILAHGIGQGSAAQRLLGSLQVDSQSGYRQLNWTPPVSVHNAIQEMAHHYRAQRRS